MGHLSRISAFCMEFAYIPEAAEIPVRYLLIFYLNNDDGRYVDTYIKVQSSFVV